MSARLLPPGPEWSEVLRRLARLGQTDVYFTPNYAHAMAPKDSVVEALLYEDSGEVLFMPITRRAIPGERGLSDFETPYGYSGPLASSRDPDFLARGWSSFAEKGKEAGIIAGLVRSNPLLDNWECVVPELHKIVTQRSTVLLSSGKSVEDVVSTYPPGLRKRLARARRKGVRVVRSGVESLREFSAIYSRRMREVGASEDYFVAEKQMRALFSSPHIIADLYVCLDAQGETVGGAITLGGSRFLNYHLSASRTSARDLSPNDVLRHAVIERFTRTNFETLNFGGGTTDEADDSLLAFNRKFSAEEATYFAGGVVFWPTQFTAVKSRWSSGAQVKEPSDSKFLSYRS